MNRFRQKPPLPWEPARRQPERNGQPRHARHLKVLAERPGGALRNDAAAKALLRWTAAERETWLDAVTNDPLLPGRILPSDYLGQQAWRRRVEVLRDASRQLRTFHRA